MIPLQQYEFTMMKLPDTTDEKAEFSRKLQKYNVSLVQYAAAFKQKEIKLQANLKFY